MPRATVPLLVLLLLASPAAAQSKAAPCSEPGYHQWDFWLGSWRVTAPDGKPQGTNRLVRAPAGCAFEEHWTGLKGVGGDSFNVYDPVRKTWTQLWGGAGGVIRLEGRLDAKGAMRLEGSAANWPAREAHPIRGTWTPMPGGVVRQEFDEQDPRTKAWSTTFVGIYRKAG